jgi:aspartyl-tRNA(Asn)/glutamyl-tRNA(Gln) amidotransferase subunit B
VSTTDRLVDYDEVLTRYEPVIGLETHVELGTASKMFCGCATTFGAEPNTQTCPVCLGMPGSLPVANAAAVESTIQIGLALGCSIASWSRFARKNYFYPDIPKGYQTSQFDEPLCVDGFLDVDVEGRTYRVEIERVHLEEDTGKNLHVGGATGRIHGADHSLVDFNRAGIPLVEIVTRPVPGAGALAPEVARAYVTELREIVQALGASDVRMEQGSLRCDVNISLNPTGAAELGTRTETKNVNSLRSVERAVRFEMRRQAAVLDDGGRGHRHHVLGPEQGGGDRLPVLPRARPRAAGPRRRLDRDAARRPARAAGRPPRPAAGGVGHLGHRDDLAGQRRSPRPGRADRRRRRCPG